MPTRRRVVPRPISDALRREILARGLRQYKLAQLAGVERASLSRFLTSGRSLSLRTADALAAALGLALRPIADDAPPEASVGSDPAEVLEHAAKLTTPAGSSQDDVPIGGEGE